MQILFKKSMNKIQATYSFSKPFELELGGTLPELQIAYTTLGKKNENSNNIIWICHALTANSDPSDWWSGLVGTGKIFDPDKHYIVCANILGSCYGTSGPLSINKITGKPYYSTFPTITVRDIVNAHELLRKHLSINKINTVIGGSLGGHQILEWAIINPDLFDNIIPIACSAKASSWAVAFNESQRMALLADQTWGQESADAAKKGLAAARSIALLSYRNYKTYKLSQIDHDPDIAEGHKATSYQNYQGHKLVNRFNAYSYYTLTKVLDSQNVGRNRGGVEKALEKIKANTLIIGINSDLIFPAQENMFIAENIKNARYVDIDSLYGHDGFLVEYQIIEQIIRGHFLRFFKPVNEKMLVN